VSIATCERPWLALRGGGRPTRDHRLRNENALPLALAATMSAFSLAPARFQDIAADDDAHRATQLGRC
jgi:hypothetical protein